MKRPWRRPVLAVGLALWCGCTPLVGDLLPASDGGDMAGARGDGSVCHLAFASPVNYPAGNDPAGAAILDVDHDGKLDLVVIDRAASQVLIFHGAGDGTFTRGDHLFAGGSDPVYIAAGDLDDHDGKLDLAIALKGGSAISVLRGTGAGFGAPAVYPSGDAPWSLATGDTTGDGISEIVTANTAAASFSLYRNHSDGTFDPAVKLALAPGNLPYGVALADLDNDGHLDLIAPCAECQVVEVLLGSGGGSFAPVLLYPTSGYSTSVDVGDVNHDGFADVALGNWRDNTVGVLLGNGDGTLRAADLWPAGVNANSVRLVDADGDGHIDLATLGFSDGNLGVLLGSGDGHFADIVTVPVGDVPGALITGDLDADGLPDFVLTRGGSHVVAVVLNRSTCAPR